MALWLRQQSTITLGFAVQGMQAAIEQAQLLDVKVRLVIVDASGLTIQMSHMDGAPRPSQAIALNKALTAVGFGRSTSEWADRLQSCSPATQVGLPLQPGMALFGGGEPFWANGEVLGAIGVSGASEANVGLCAKAAAQRINDLVFASLVEKTLRHALQHQDAKFVSYAAYAIREWRTRVDSPITRRLVSLLVMLFGPQRLSALPEIIESLRTLLERGRLSAEESGSLIDTLPVVFDCTLYDATSDLGHEAATISIVRTKCVQLARSLSANRTEPCGELARVTIEAKEDPLPEVRFA